MINIDDVVRVPLGEDDLADCIRTAAQLAPRIGDRPDLHSRDGLERFVNVLLGGVAERRVLAWLHQQGKHAEPAVEKEEDGPDAGHDLLLRRGQRRLRCSVKSSLTAMHDLPCILSDFTIATKRGELRNINIQVYFWLDVRPGEGHRTTVPSLRNAAIIGWAGLRDVQQFRKYATEARESPAEFKLHQMRPIADLLPLID